MLCASSLLGVRSVWNPRREAGDPLWIRAMSRPNTSHAKPAKIAKKTWRANDLDMMRDENDGRFGSGGQIHSVAAQSVAL